MDIDPTLQVGPSRLVDGPSALPAQALNSSHPQPRSTPPTAPERPLPAAHFYSVEYPGYVRHASAPLAIEHLGGQHAIETAFRRATGRDRVESLLELRLRPDNPYAHPIPGEVVPTSNIVLKVVKRKWKRKDVASGDGAIGEYTVEAVGVVPKTARFRSECAYTKKDIIVCLNAERFDFRHGGLPVPTGHVGPSCEVAQRDGHHEWCAAALHSIPAEVLTKDSVSGRSPAVPYTSREGGVHHSHRRSRPLCNGHRSTAAWG